MLSSFKPQENFPSTNVSNLEIAQPSAKKTDFNINRKGFIETEGLIEEALPSATFRVELQNGHKILARLSGRMRMHRIMLVPGDRVKIEMSQYDLTKGRITYRL